MDSTPASVKQRRQIKRQQIALDRLLLNLTPEELLSALAEPAKLDADVDVSSAGRLNTTLKASIAGATAAEREWAARAAKAHIHLEEWCDELASWKWPPEESAGIGNPFEAPAIANRGRHGSSATGEYCGGLHSDRSWQYESKLEEIKHRLQDLDLDDLKDRALDVYTPSRPSQPSSPVSDTLTASRTLTHVDDLTAFSTALVLQCLPFVSKLSGLMNLWAVRLAVSRSVPAFFIMLNDTNIALESAWNAMGNPEQESPNPSNAETTVSRHYSRDSFGVMRSVVGEKVASLGKQMDKMLDLLEGREDTIPDKWIDSVEGAESVFSNWVVESERLLLAREWRDRSSAQLRDPVKLDPVPEDRQAGGIDDSSHTREDEPSDPAPVSNGLSPTDASAETIAHKKHEERHEEHMVPQVRHERDSAQEAQGKIAPAPSTPPQQPVKEPNTSNTPTEKPLDLDDTQQSNRSSNGSVREPSSPDRNGAMTMDPSLISSPNIEVGSKHNTPDTIRSSISRGSPFDHARRNNFASSPTKILLRSLSSDLRGEDIKRNLELEIEQSFDSMPRRASVTSIESVQRGNVKTIEIKRKGSGSSVSSVSALSRNGSASLSPPQSRSSKESVHVPREFIAGGARSRASLQSFTDSTNQSPNAGKTSAQMSDGVPSSPVKTYHDTDSGIKDNRPVTPEPKEKKSTEASPRKRAPHADKIDNKISSILDSIPAHIRFTTEGDEQESSGTWTTPEPDPSSPLKVPRKRQTEDLSSPSFTLAAAESARKGPKQRFSTSSAPEVKLYHLRHSESEAPIKLFVRLVGENGERVMVRVGGGWADLGEYLRDYAVHHGRRSASDGKFVEVQEESKSKNTTPTGPSKIVSTPGDSNLQSSSSQRPSPLGSHPPSSTLNIRKTRPTTPLYRRSPTPTKSLCENQSSSRPSSSAGFRSVSRQSQSQTPEDDRKVGLAGPRSKRPDPLSPQKQAWVDGVIGQVRRVSGGLAGSSLGEGSSAKSDRRRSQTPQLDSPTTPEATSAKSKNGDTSGTRQRSNSGFKEIDKVGGTTRVFRRGRLNP